MHNFFKQSFSNPVVVVADYEKKLKESQACCCKLLSRETVKRFMHFSGRRFVFFETLCMFAYIGFIFFLTFFLMDLKLQLILVIWKCFWDGFKKSEKIKKIDILLLKMNIFIVEASRT